jgi:hypothetical protein
MDIKFIMWIADSTKKSLFQVPMLSITFGRDHEVLALVMMKILSLDAFKPELLENASLLKSTKLKQL